MGVCQDPNNSSHLLHLEWPVAPVLVVASAESPSKRSEYVASKKTYILPARE